MLLSASMSAQVVATADDADFTSIEEAIAAWQENGGVLRLLADCEYNATATDTIDKDATLDLNGKTLTWNTDFGSLSKAGTLPALLVHAGTLTIKASAADDATQKGTLVLNVSHDKGTNLCGVLVGNTTPSTAKLAATDGVNIVGRFATAPTYKDKNGVHYNQTYLSSSIIYALYGAADIENTNIRMQGECSYALNFHSKAGELTCANNTVTYEADETPTQCIRYVCGLNIAKVNFVSDNNKADVSAANGSYLLKGATKDVAAQALALSADNLTIKGSEGLYKVDAAGADNRSAYIQGKIVSIEDGTFAGQVSAPKLGSSISGGRYTTPLDVRFLAAGGYFEKEGEYYVIKHGKSYVVRINGTDYCDTDDWGAVCSHSADTYTEVQIIAHTDFAIPEGVYITLGFTTSTDADTFSAMTITNNGNMRFGANWKRATIINNGTLEVNTGATFAETAAYTTSFTNNATGTLYIKPNISTAAITFGDYFTLTNNGGEVSVTNGRFTDNALAQIYKEGEYNYLAEGYISSKQGDGYHHIIAADDVVATVGGVKYSNLYDAIRYSSPSNPAILQKDYTRKSGMSLAGYGECALDLNGKTLTLDYDAADKTQEFIILKNIKLTIQGRGTIAGNGDMLFSIQGNNKKASANYTVLNVGKDVTIRQTKGWYAVCAVYDRFPYGITVNFDGKVEQAKCAFYVNGTLTNTSETAPAFNIGNTATFNCSEALAYAAGYARWNYAGNATVGNYGFEMRAGELTMNGGSIVSTATAPADDQFNGNGSTSQACGIAVCQHGTQLPVTVTIDGGAIKAYTPLYQANPQDNPQEAIDQVSVTVNDAKVYSTSNNIVWSANKKISIHGGVYNLSPAAYVAAGKAVVANTDEATKDIYPYAIGTEEPTMVTAQSGDWDNPETWEGMTVPTNATPVRIAHDVTVPAGSRADVYGIAMEEGTIRVEGTLVIGNKGISSITDASQLQVGSQAQVAISPAATINNQPLATVYKELGEHTYIGIPTTGTPGITCDATLTIQQWNTATGWEDTTALAPFHGYAVTAETTPAAPVAFAGQLTGNQDATFHFEESGFQFIANSWTAKADVTELLNQIDKHSNQGRAEAAVKMYIARDTVIGGEQYIGGTYVDVNRTTLDADETFRTTWNGIAPMTAFFVYANESGDMTLSYEHIIWNAILAQAHGNSTATTDNNAMRIRLTAEDGKSDYVYLREGETFHSTKMQNEGDNVNIYAATETGNYSTFVAEDIDGTAIDIRTNGTSYYTLSFDWITGETFSIKDTETGLITAMTEDDTYSFEAEPNSTAHRFVIMHHDIPSGTDHTATGNTTNGIYSITGQYLGTNTAPETLPKGVYIVNGQKYVK